MNHSEEMMDAPDGSAFTWIFDHCVRYPGTYEIPLRTMYTLNCNSMRYQGAVPTEFSFPPQALHSPHSSESSHDTSSLDAASDFKAQLSQQISRLPSQPCSLPPSFITTFLRRSFAPHFDDVDWAQALTALDYLRDFETRRRKEVVAALKRLSLNPEDLKRDSELAKKWPGVLTWYESINSKGKKVESLYSHVYIGLRRWTLISEMLQEPYNKVNCTAMLNTLFPPVPETKATPTPQLSPQVLKAQRDGIFRYVSAVETNGKSILEKIVLHGARPGEKNGWPLVREAMDKYLRTANDMIDDCSMVNDPDSLQQLETERKGHKGRKADSGVSFGASSAGSSYSHEAILDKPLPPSPYEKTKGGSTLERLTRELRKFSDSGKSKNLKKMQSTSALNARATNSPNYSTDSFFDVDEPKRRRLLWEAKNRKWIHSKQSSSNSQEL